MGVPRGLLVTPLGTRSDGTPHTLELDNLDRLKVLLDAVTGSIKVGTYPHDVYNDLTAALVTKLANIASGSASLYTVPANKTLYLTSLYLSAWNGAAALGNARLIVNDPTPTTIYQFAINMGIALSESLSESFPVPLKLPAASTVTLAVSIALVNVWGGFTGYLV